MVFWKLVGIPPRKRTRVSPRMQPIRPNPLKPNQNVSVVAPAGPVDPARLGAGLEILSKRYKSSCSNSCLDRRGYVAGSDRTRLNALQSALDDEESSALIAARGGYGTSRIVDELDLGEFRKHPKWFGFVIV